MATHPSAAKRARQSDKRSARNRTRKSRLRTEVKKLVTLIQNGNKDEAQKLLPQVVKEITKAKSAGLLHKNNAARRTGRLSAAIDRIGATAK